jgi:hypothetical protein
MSANCLPACSFPIYYPAVVLILILYIVSELERRAVSSTYSLFLLNAKYFIWTMKLIKPSGHYMYRQLRSLYVPAVVVTMYRQLWSLYVPAVVVTMYRQLWSLYVPAVVVTICTACCGNYMYRQLWSLYVPAVVVTICTGSCGHYVPAVVVTICTGSSGHYVPAVVVTICTGSCSHYTYRQL